jgi:hypothetical protein
MSTAYHDFTPYHADLAVVRLPFVTFLGQNLPLRVLKAQF